MNKQDLINKVAESAGITKAAAALAVNTITFEIGGALAKGDNVTLVGFGTFKVTQRLAREGRNVKQRLKLSTYQRPILSTFSLF